MYLNYIDMPETNPVSRVHNVAGISWLQYMQYVMLFRTIKVLYFILVGICSEVFSQCHIRLFSEVSLCRAFLVFCSDYFLNDSEMAVIVSIFTSISTSFTFILIFHLMLMF